MSTIAPPSPETARTASGSDQSGSDQSDIDTPAFGLDLLATAGLLAYSIAVAYGFSRVFNGWEFLSDLVTVAVVGHGLSYLLRRVQAPSIVAITVVVVVLTWLVTFLYYRESLSGFLPLGETWDLVGRDFRAAADEFQTSAAPVPYSGGWAFLAGSTTAATVWLADTFAFRAQAKGEALVPGAVLFVFIAALGVDERRVACSLAVIGTGFCAMALMRQRMERRQRTVIGRLPHPAAATVPTALVCAVLVMGGAWIVGPRIPGANSEPLFDTRGDRGDSTEVVSPLVDIRSRLVNQAETELFTVTATSPSYWRVAALGRFGDERWDLPADLLDQLADQAAAPQPGSVANEQVVTILGLGDNFIPAAPEPAAATGNGVHFNANAAALVKVGSDLDEGDVYTVQSAMPRYTPDVVRAATSSSPPSDVFTELPDDLPPEIKAAAQTVTQEQSTSFDKLLTLQDWFRNEFTYDVEVPEGNGPSAMMNFLENRVGYCEQFAGTFAAMARTLGVPSRVSVGFTQGEQLDNGSFLVRGRNAHAWPEVWFDDLGWIAFEPTPGRGMPGSDSYTGVQPAQDEGIDQPDDGARSTTTTSTTTTTTIAGGAAPAPTTTIAGAAVPTTSPPARPPAAAPNDSSSLPWLAILGVLVAVAFVLSLPGLVRRWRRSRMKPTTDPAHMLLELWDRALAALGALGFRPSATMTPTEVSAGAAESFPPVAEPMYRLADVATTASFGPRETVQAIADADRHDRRGDSPHAWCSYIETAVENSLTWRERLVRYFTVWK